MVVGVGSPLGIVMYHFQQKLKSLKAKIPMRNREEFGNVFENKKRLLCELDLINRKGMEEVWDEDMKAKEKYLMNQIKARER